MTTFNFARYKNVDNKYNMRCRYERRLIMKKITLLILLVISILFPVSFSHAQETNVDKAYLIGEEGKIIELSPIDVTLRNANRKTIPLISEGSLLTKEYMYEVTPQNFGNTGTLQDIKWDSTGGLKAWVKISYGYSNGGYLLKSVEANWRKEDSSFVLSNAQITGICNGVNYYNGSPVTNQIKTWYVNPVKTIKYTNFTTPINGNASGLMGGKSSIHIRRGSSSWDLVLPVNAYHSNG